MLRRSTRNRKRRLSSDHRVIQQKLKSRHSCSEQLSNHHHINHMKQTGGPLCEECELVVSTISNNSFPVVKEAGVTVCANVPYIATECCSMCQFIHYNIQRYNLEKNTSFELRLFSSRKSFSWLYRSRAKGLDTPIILAVVPQYFFTREGSASDFIRNCVPEFLISAYHDLSPFCISGLSIDAMNVDFGFIHKSLSYCAAHHCCGRPAYSIQGCITVYDYKNDCTVDVELPCLYIALSYVWGDSGRKEYGRYNRRPQVLEDLIAIAEQLKIPYVWVDKYCIDQTNPHKKQQQLNSMHAIYNNAYLTVVDGAGSDMHCGLSGISRPRTGGQVRVQFGGQLWISTLRNPQTSIQNSPWNSRGWTYQEAIASPRLLIFTEEQVYFECKAMRCWETLYISLDSHHCKNKSQFKGSLCEPLFCQETRNPTKFEQWTDFPRYIKNYTCRTLTNSYDALNAITGVLGFLEKGGKKLFNFWGIPLFSFFPRHPSALASGMAWTLENRKCEGSWRPILRRRTFPSWSWTGWEGVVGWEGVAGSFDLGNFYYIGVSIRIQTEKDSERSVPWETFWESEGGMEMDRRTNHWASGLGLKEEYNYPWLEITTEVIKVSLKYIPPCDIEKMTAETPELNGYLKAGFFIEPPNDDPSGSCITPIAFPHDCYPELSVENADAICRQQWDCMLLGYIPEVKQRYSRSSFPFVIMLNHDRRREVTERVWAGRLFWRDGWKDICDIEKRCVRLY
ncbi:HET-domain-containing protein [Aspergillus bertholletiae]|uniref:HET-domain-containing protein n=1 Tax=Aspergillus bertholletiae TaxID=1226010 RepID=A0A5N7B198_9EURO|nr:HET-domain-containing protein [Aspergillus bertholletiae]